jgi:hypothetical protein
MNGRRSDKEEALHIGLRGRDAVNQRVRSDEREVLALERRERLTSHGATLEERYPYAHSTVKRSRERRQVPGAP